MVPMEASLFEEARGVYLAVRQHFSLSHEGHRTASQTSSSATTPFDRFGTCIRIYIPLDHKRAVQVEFELVQLHYTLRSST